VNYFAGRGHEAHLISSRFTTGYDGFDSRIQMHPLARLLPQIWMLSGYLNGIAWLFQIRALIKRIKPDIVNAHYIGVPAYLAVASGFHPLVLTAWGSDVLIDPKKNPIRRFLTKQSLQKADSITWVSNSLREEIINLGATSEKLVITTMGVDTLKFKPGARNKEIWRKLGINNSPVVISTRTLNPIYDVGTLIRAVPLILLEVPQTKFVIIGDGSQKKYLENMADKLGVSNSLRFLGRVPNDSLPPYLCSSDVYVSTALSDSLGISTMEARSCGIPVVVGDLPATREWIIDGEDGLIFHLRDYRALAEKVIRLLKSEELRKRLGVAGRVTVVERADYNKEMAKVMRIYEQLKHFGFHPEGSLL